MSGSTHPPSKENVKTVDLGQLSVTQLAHLKQSVENELVVLQNSIQSLKIVQMKLQESRECLDKIPMVTGHPMLVPLTGSMYVPGRVVDPEYVMIEIGTGYYARMKVEDAKAYFARRIAFVVEQADKIQAIGIDKSKAREHIVGVLEMKVEQEAAQRGLLKQS